MITRVAKLLLVAGIALFYTLVVFNNLTDFDSNYQFVRHVFNGFYLSRQSRHVAVHSIAFVSSCVLPGHYRLGICHHDPALVGRSAPAARCASAGGRIQCGQAPGRDGAHSLFADVAGSLSLRRRRMVPDVAVAYVERPGPGIPHVRNCRADSFDHDATGF